MAKKKKAAGKRAGKRTAIQKRGPVRRVAPKKAAPKAPKKAVKKAVKTKKKAAPRARAAPRSETASRPAPAVPAKPNRAGGPLRPARVVDVGEVLAGDPTTESIPDSPEFKHRILAEGDSWFSINAVPGTNLLKALQFAQSTIIVNIAEPGDTLVRMAALVKNPWMRKFIIDRDFASNWDLLLLSGGGNDLIDSAFAIIKAPTAARSADPADYVDAVELDRLIASVQDGFRRLAALRDESGSACVGKPIVTHTYDYATPRPAPANFLIFNARGPWLYRVFEERGTPNELRLPVTRLLFDRLADAIIALARGPQAIPNFHVVDTRGALTPAAADAVGRSGDWENEIHPSAAGYRKLSGVVSPVVAALLP